MWCLLRVLPLLIGSIIPQDNVALEVDLETNFGS